MDKTTQYMICLVNASTNKKLLVTNITEEYFICNRIRYVSKQDVLNGKYFIIFLTHKNYKTTTKNT